MTLPLKREPHSGGFTASRIDPEIDAETDLEKTELSERKMTPTGLQRYPEMAQMGTKSH